MRARDLVVAFLAGVLVTSIAATFAASAAERETEALRDSVAHHAARTRYALGARDSAEQRARLATLAVDASTPRWDAERASLEARAHEAGGVARALRERLSALAAPDVQPLLDSLYAVHEAETGGLRATIRSQREEVAALWTERAALHSLVARQDSALDAALAEIRAREQLEAALRRQLRPSLFSRLVGDFGRGLLVGAAAGYVLAGG